MTKNKSDKKAGKSATKQGKAAAKAPKKDAKAPKKDAKAPKKAKKAPKKAKKAPKKDAKTPKKAKEPKEPSISAETTPVSPEAGSQTPVTAPKPPPQPTKPTGVTAPTVSVRPANPATNQTRPVAVERAGHPAAMALSELLRCPRGKVDAARDFDSAATPGFSGHGKANAASRTAAIGTELGGLQERLYASSKTGEPQPARVLLVLQGMDTSGKSGVVSHVIGMVDPQGVHIQSFKAPTPAERRHDFLWRIRRALPEPGMIGIFDRSHYEDVLIQRVEAMARPATIEARYDAINAFEREVADTGTRIIKCFLNISPDVQKKRLADRLADPTKYWKYNPGDLATRAKWGEYMAAYGIALERCNEDYAPWFVIPSDHKWYRNWAVATLLYETLSGMDLTWPPASFDVAAEQAKVAAS